MHSPGKGLGTGPEGSRCHPCGDRRGLGHSFERSETHDFLALPSFELYESFFSHLRPVGPLVRSMSCSKLDVDAFVVDDVDDVGVDVDFVDVVVLCVLCVVFVRHSRQAGAKT